MSIAQVASMHTNDRYGVVKGGGEQTDVGLGAVELLLTDHQHNMCQFAGQHARMARLNLLKALARGCSYHSIGGYVGARYRRQQCVHKPHKLVWLLLDDVALKNHRC